MKQQQAQQKKESETVHRHSFTPSAGGGAQRQVRRWWHSQTTGLGSQGLIPLSIRLSSFGRREDDRPHDSWLSGSDFGSDRVLMMTSVSQVHICCSLTVCTVLLLSAPGCLTISPPLHSLSLSSGFYGACPQPVDDITALPNTSRSTTVDRPICQFKQMWS